MEVIEHTGMTGSWQFYTAWYYTTGMYFGDGPQEGIMNYWLNQGGFCRQAG
jgi:hypothetical protein